MMQIATLFPFRGNNWFSVRLGDTHGLFGQNKRKRVADGLSHRYSTTLWNATRWNGVNNCQVSSYWMRRNFVEVFIQDAGVFFRVCGFCPFCFETLSWKCCGVDCSTALTCMQLQCSTGVIFVGQANTVRKIHVLVFASVS